MRYAVNIYCTINLAAKEQLILDRYSDSPVKVVLLHNDLFVNVNRNTFEEF